MRGELDSDSILDHQAIFELMLQDLVVATRDLFAHYEVAIESCPLARLPTDGESAGMAVIGYAGRGVRGALVVVARESAVRAWMTAVGVPDGDIDDTLGEFSNMLLGQLKGRLLPRGISIFATTPTTAWGTGLRLSSPPGPSTWSGFDGPGWCLSLRLDAKFAREFGLSAFSRTPAPPQPGERIDLMVDVAEGEP